MNIKKLVLLAALAGLPAMAVAEEQQHSAYAIAVSDVEGADVVNLAFGGENLDFDLHDMQEGENRSIVDDSGRTILVTREADGFRFDVEGKSIKVPAFEGGHHGAVYIGDAGAEDVDVHVMGNASTTTLRARPAPGSMIMTEKPVDDATRQAIESLLQSAGHEGEVRFMDREGIAGGAHGYKMIHKQVEVAQ